MEAKKITYRLQFNSYWHAGGKGGSTKEVDNAVLKDKNGLPYIGGKTMKGLIKDAANFINTYDKDLVSDAFMTTVFYEKDKAYINEDEVKNNFSSATLSPTISEAYAHLLFHKKSSTAIVTNKQAKKHSLRTTEVTVPLVLEGSIANFTGDDMMLENSFKALKKLGEKRFKGLGRCQIEIKKE